MHATRAAVEEGILPGGGVALLRSIKALGRLKAENDDQKTGIDIVRKALSTPARSTACCACALTDGDAKHDESSNTGKSQAIFATAADSLCELGLSKKDKRSAVSANAWPGCIDLPEYPPNFRPKRNIRGPLTPQLPVC
jgi:hypothetical protein